LRIGARNSSTHPTGQRACRRPANFIVAGQFTYNRGPRWFGAKGFATLSQALRAGQLEAVPAVLMLYVNPGGPSEAGLRRRRKAEGTIWNASPDQGSTP
jgi:GH24 family phage-related lysozyme (muramidase)